MDESKATYRNLVQNYISLFITQEFYCHLCKVPLSSHAVAIDHIHDEEHKVFASVILFCESSAFTLKENALSEVQFQEFVTNCIYKQYSNYQCNVCYCSISNIDDVLSHIQGVNHTSRMKNLRSIILKTDQFWYQCNNCHCKISGLRNVFEHIQNIHRTDFENNPVITDNIKIAENETRIVTDVPTNFENNPVITDSIKTAENETKIVTDVPTNFENNPVITDSIKTAKNETKIVVDVPRNYVECELIIPPELKWMIKAHNIQVFKEKLYCKACDVTMNNDGAIEGHLTSHLRKSQFSVNTPKKNVITNVRKNYVKCQLVIPPELKWMIEAHDIQVFKEKLYCKACDVTMNNDGAIDSHLTSHLRKSQFSVKPTDSQSKSDDKSKVLTSQNVHNSFTSEQNAMYCSTCDVRMLDTITMDAHYSGRRHKHNVSLLKDAANNIAYCCPLCNIEFNLDELLIRHFNGKTHETNSLIKNASIIVAKIEKAVTINDSGDTSKMNSYSCPLCNVNFNDHVSLTSHFNEQSHKRHKISLSNNVHAPNSMKIINNALSNDVNDVSRKIQNLNLNESKKVENQKKKTCNNSTMLPNLNKTLNSKYLGLNIDSIYDIDIKKLNKIKLSTRLSLALDTQHIYCLICQKNVSDNLQSYYEHIRCTKHDEHLTEMENDHKEFENYPNQFSVLTLTKEFIIDVPNEFLECLICNVQFRDQDPLIRKHISQDTHKQKCEQRNAISDNTFKDILSRIKNSWYSIQRYWCTVCSKAYISEIEFKKHLNSPNHSTRITKELRNKELIYDSCTPCAQLWLGNPNIYPKHCEHNMHKYMAKNSIYTVQEMPESVTKWLDRAEDKANNLIIRLDAALQYEQEKEDKLLKCLKDTVKVRFPSVKIYPFGSRVSGLSLPDSDIDVLLDDGDTYYRYLSKSQQVHTIEIIQKCLLDEEQSWAIDEVILNCRTPIIKVYHRATQLNCDISVKNGLSVENTKLVKRFCDVYPLCRKLILFVRKWLQLCGLTGVRGIINYAITWFIIFYLQKKHIFPSIADLIKLQNESKIIAGWETGLCYDFDFKPPNLTFAQLLIGFFKFYANFDFKYQVACPLLGDTIGKRAFAKPKRLPKEMALYVNYINTTPDPEHFRIDSAMCIQDPLNLSYNITKSVDTLTLNRFRQYCMRSANALNDC